MISSRLPKINKSGMLEKLRSFPEQVEKASKISCEGIPKLKFDRVIIAGMGGSAIGGELLKAWALEEHGINIFVNRDYKLPKFANNATLVFAVSYSGNTEEVLSAFLDGISKNCKIISITSGGKLEKLSKKYRKYLIKIPGGYQPREAIAWLLFPIAKVLEAHGILKLRLDDTLVTLRNLRNKLVPENTEGDIAKEVALKLKAKIPIIYGYDWLCPVAKRWRTQLNENAKILAFDSSFPEMAHNEIVGLYNDKRAAQFMPVILRSKEEEKKIKNKIEATKKLVFKDWIEVWAQGKTTLAKMLSLLYIGDFVSYYLALARKVDPTPVEIIEKLKRVVKGIKL